MWKKNIVICIMAIVLCVGGIALAKAVKLNLVPVNHSPDPDGFGRAVLNYAEGEDKTIIQVNCWGLTPGNGYGVNLANGMGSAGGAVASANGTITIHGEQEGDQSGCIVRIKNRTQNRPALRSD